MEHARLPHGHERTTLDANRDEVRRAGARELAKGGRLGAAARLILRNRLGRPGVRPSDVELRLRAHELRELELLAEDAERR
jgi:hypothetical protein